jgi:two-component sensor histidine kinase
MRGHRRSRRASADLPAAAARGAALRALRAQSQGNLSQTEQRLEFALRAARLGSWDFDIASGRFSSSGHSRTIFGVGPDEPFERAEDVVARIHPDDRAARQAAIDQAIATGEDFDIEYRVVKPGGVIGWVQARGRALFEGGRAVRLGGISLDVTERKRAEEHQRLLLAELNHRVKNTLATVQSIAMQTRSAADLDDAFIKRILALSRAHDLLTEASWQGASLADVITRTLDPHLTAGYGARMRIGGPAIQLSPNAAVTLHMGFHELATNAIKYGALASPEGRIDVAWTIDAGAEPAMLDIAWRESGGPAVAAPTRRGFGSRMIERGLAHELNGVARLTFNAEGVACHMRLPLSAKLRVAPSDAAVSPPRPEATPARSRRGRAPR